MNVLPQVALSPGRVRWECPDAARLHHQRAKKDSATESGWVADSVADAGSFLDPQLEHGEACSTAEAARGHCACVHAVVWGLKLADPRHHHGTERAHSIAIQGGCYFHRRCCPRTVAPPWMFVSPPPMQQQPEETLRRRHLMANSRTTETTSRTCVTRAFSLPPFGLGRRTGDRTQPSR